MTINPDFATNNDLEQIIALWMLVFGDEREYVETFLESFFTDGYSLPVIRRDGKIVCMLNLLEFDLREFGLSRRKCSYIFAAATHPDYRGQGLMRELMGFALEVCKSRGHGMAFLIPASQSLYGFYAALGFRESFYGWEFALEGEPSGEQAYEIADLNICDDAEWERFRASYTEYIASQPLAVIKGSAYLDYSMREYFIGGGLLDAVTDGKKTMGYLLYRGGDAMTVEGFIPCDTGVDYRKLGKMLSGAYFKCDYALAAAMEHAHTPIRAGMCYPLCPEVTDILDRAGKTLYISGFGEEKTEGTGGNI